MGSPHAEGLLLQVGKDCGDGMMGLPYGWSQEGALFQAGVSHDEDSKGLQDGVLGEKSLDLPPCNQHCRKPPRRAENPGQLHCPLQTSSNTPSTAARRPEELSQISTPSVARRNAFCHGTGCEEHSCSLFNIKDSRAALVRFVHAQQSRMEIGD